VASSGESYRGPVELLNPATWQVIGRGRADVRAHALLETQHTWRGTVTLDEPLEHHPVAELVLRLPDGSEGRVLVTELQTVRGWRSETTQVAVVVGTGPPPFWHGGSFAASADLQSQGSKTPIALGGHESGSTRCRRFRLRCAKWLRLVKCTGCAGANAGGPRGRPGCRESLRLMGSSLRQWARHEDAIRQGGHPGSCGASGEAPGALWRCRPHLGGRPGYSRASGETPGAFGDDRAVQEVPGVLGEVPGVLGEVPGVLWEAPGVLPGSPPPLSRAPGRICRGARSALPWLSSWWLSEALPGWEPPRQRFTPSKALDRR